VCLGIFIRVVRSYGIEFDAEAFCEAFSHIHELHFQTKATSGLHNNFSCYNFAYRRGSMFLALAYRSKWPNEWTKEWFYMKNDLTERVDISGIIQSPIVTGFILKKPMCYVNFKAQASIVAFNVVSTYIGTRDLVQEYLAFKTWPLAFGGICRRPLKGMLRMLSQGKLGFNISINLKMSSENPAMVG
jgi:hypothetical protein